ncbi:BTAD domain-containing putative transcriptional regulator [Streptomyces sp. WMMC500]|uniref:AfsR/SARP family transcriptional regulator n=1 Tax=Streptomyces sp. WMMC500 TaxID=3015154 RepID=UPI00248BCDF7|nr:BTAD domain-containing putative transcriptional regulator [Streptomyces sp. WMMC500]WBB61228.1 BTAD domain-containing putative transcriptional regulator [Streptomyces sp. WMMC500]
MRFRVLGPLQVWDGADWSLIRAPQQRVVLAVLLTEAGRMVTTDRLTDEIWGERPPKTAASVVQGYVMRLRRLLGGAEASRLTSHDRGYRLVVEEPDLDARVFEQLAESGKRSLADGDPDAAATRLNEALALWRGPALDDVPASRTVAAEAARLEQCRLDAVDARLGTDLALGRHADVVGELRRLVGEHPLREDLRAQFMLALYRCGRRAEALEVYRGGRRLLVDELGMEPGPRLRELEQAMLSDDPRLAAPAREPAAGATATAGARGRVALRQAPADVAGFTGRDAELRRLDALLPGGDGPSHGGPGAAELVVCTIAGPAGVGKTALAVRWAHRVEDRFPDGQLYVNLRGYAAGAPLRPLDALARFLGALGVRAAEVPVEQEEAAALYRSLLAAKRMLVLLDNAQHADQVRPLLPGSGDSLVLVTSRDQFGGLVAREGAVPLTLDVLAAAEARALLVRLLGPDRVRGESAAVAELARLCGHLPLALRIAAANILTHPGLSIEDFTERLRTGDRLAMLEVHGDAQAAVRGTFDLSYFALQPESRRLFRLLGLVPGPDIAAEGAAALAGLTPSSAAHLLNGLVRTHLVEQPVPGRYALHDLLRLYAAERAAEEESDADRRAALGRLFGHYLSRVDATAQVLYPDKLRLPPPETDRPRADAPFADQDRASAWIEAERPNLTAAVHHAAGHGPQAAGWRLADSLRGYFDLRRDTVDWPAVARSGLQCAEADGDRRAQGAAHLSLALFHWNQAQYRPAIDHYTRAKDLGRETGWLDGHATALANLGIVYHELGHLQQAAEHYREALAIHQRTGYLAGQGSHLGNLGECYHVLGRLDDALAALTEARDLRRKVGARAPEADALRVLAAVHRDAGRQARALELADAAVALARGIGDLRFQADALNTLATIRHRLGHHPQAIADHREALRIARDIGSGYAEAEALIGLAAAHRHTGDPRRAADEAGEALDIARRTESRLLEGQCLTGLAAVHLDRGDHEAAVDHARQALTIHTETGHRLGQARAHLVAHHALRACERPDQSHEHRALALFTEIGADWRDHARTLIRQA